MTELEVTTTAGAVHGRVRNGVLLFAGIPYAAPPVGARRFAPPAPVETWTGVRDATRFGPAAPQLPGGGLTNAAPVAWHEDCLTLNVCTPAADSGARPVMVWIHGGDFRHGTGATPWYDGTSFAANGDVVVVTINYRLGALGFCRLPGAPTSGINGILDQVAALQWVQTNIAAFGGDPSRVTIAGESAGAFSVATLMSLDAAAGKFRAAILQSGAGHHALSVAEATEAADRLCAELTVDGVRPDLGELRTMPALAILEAQQRVEAAAAGFLGAAQSPFYPSITAGLLDARPIDRFAAGVASHIAVLTGTNADETSLWGMQLVAEDRLATVVRRYVADGSEADELLAAYRAAMPGATAGQLSLAFSTDHTFRIPAVRLGEARAAHGATTWMYEFDWKSRAFDGALGACHALEIPFTFATLQAKGTDVFLGTDDLPTALSEVMHRAWTSFIHHADPRVPGWLPYELPTRLVQRFAEDDLSIVADPLSATRVAWDRHRR